MNEKKKPALEKRAPKESSNTNYIATPAQAQQPNHNWKPVVKKHLEKGIVTIPVAYKDKRALGTDWQKTTDPCAAFETRVGPGERCNFGILLGTASQVVDVDLDCHEAGMLADKYLPVTGYVWGRDGNPASHRLYRCQAERLKTEQFRDQDGKMIVELRGDGGQSVIPPSVHTSGECIKYVREDDPANVDYEELRQRVARLAAASLLLRGYPDQGGRNAYVLLLAGFLAHAGWTAEAAQEFLEPIVIAAGDDEFDSRMTTIRATFDKFAAGEEVTGQPKLAEEIGDDSVKLIVKWLDIKNFVAKRRPQLADEVERFVEQAGKSPATFVADILKNEVAVGRLVELHQSAPALFTSLLASLEAVKGIGKPGSTSIRQAIVAEAKRPATKPTSGGRFEANDEGTFLITDSEKPPKRLANFGAKVTNEIIYDDGVEQQRYFEVEVQLKGRTIRCNCSAAEFAGMGWVAPQCGIEAIIEPGQSNKDNLRTAIQELSDDVKVTHRFTATGWVKDPETGVYCFVHAGGAIGPQGPMDHVQTELSGALSRYELPEPAKAHDLERAYAAFQRLQDIAPRRIMIPLLAGAIRAVFGPADFGLFLVGQTGTGKSALSALINQFFGPTLHSRNLPGSFTSTGNALEMQAFMARDTVFTIDDFAPTASRYDTQKMQSAADRMIRALGNGASRARLTSDATLRDCKPPRCMVLMSGEDVPQGMSARARLLILEVQKGDIKPEAWKAALTECQEHAAEGVYAGLMSAFIRWLAEDYENRIAHFGRIRDKIIADMEESSNHRRTDGTEAQLWAAWRMFALFLKSVGVISTAKQKELVSEARSAITEAVAVQQEYQVESDEVDRFLVYIRTALFQKIAHLQGPEGKPPFRADLCGYTPSESGGKREGGTCIGIYDGQNQVLLNPTSAKCIAWRVANAEGSSFALSANALGKRLHDRGLLLAIDEARGKKTVRRRLGEERKGYWVIDAQLLGIPHVETDDERRTDYLAQMASDSTACNAAKTTL